MRVPPDPSEIVEVYIDESSQTKHRFLVIGGVMVDMPNSAGLNGLITKARLPDLPEKEAKWTKVSRTKLPAYIRIVDVLFDNPKLVHFHSLVVDTTQLNHHRWNGGSRDIGFNKEIYQLAQKFARLYPKSLLHLYPDQRPSNQSPEELRMILNRGRAKSGDPRDWPFRRCQFRDSSSTLPIQLADIIIGAIAFHLNGHINADGASRAKTELSNHILERAGIQDITRDTARHGTFTIWHRQLRKGVS